MFKSAVPSVAPSASASASSHDTHSLPPAFKGPVQRFLAVSLPTITLTPDFIDILDSVDVIIPSRIQVTIRWWNEDTASSLAVFPRLNSPLPPSVEVHQTLLRRQQLDKEKARQSQQQALYLQEKQERPLSSIASNSAQPSLTTPPQPRSMAAKVLRRPWTARGGRLMNVLRIGNNKSKENKAPSSKTPLVAQDTDARRSNQPTQDHLAVTDTLSSKSKRRQDAQPKSDPIPTLTPTTSPNSPPVAAAPAEAKPLPTLPDAAYPVTVAYPVRCSLDQLYRYFLEMTSLSLEIQITPNLTILASVPNLADLFRNIHGTFSGVFPFTTVLQNDDPKLTYHKIFSRRTVLGMAVFQAWCQDTSDVGDSSEGSDSASNASIHNDEQTPTHHHHYHHHRPHHAQGSMRHHRQPSYQYFGHPTEHSAEPYRHPPPPPPLQRPIQQQQQSHRLRPSLGFPSKQPLSVHPLSPSAVIDPAAYHQHQQKALQHQHQRGGNAVDGYPPVEPRHPDSHKHRQSSLRFDDEPTTYRHPRFTSHPHPHAARPSGIPYENQHHRGDSGGGRGQDMTGAASVGSINPSSRQYPNIKLPIPDLGLLHDASYRRPVRNNIQRPSQDDSLFRHRRSEDTNTTTHHSQGSRSRPRAGATAAVIGRLDSVLARGEDLLQGMKTSLELDPDEVRTRSARHLRSSVMKDDHQDDSRFRPHHESLPYWPSKSRFKLELSIPTAYLTSHGLLKGSKHRKYHSLPLPEHQQPHSKQQRQAYHRSQQQQQRPPPQSTTSTAANTAAGSAEVLENLVRPPRHVRQSNRDSRGQEFWTSMMGGSGGHRREDSLSGGPESTPRGLRRSGKPIQVEKVARMSDLARLQLAQEESAATPHGHYQSFQASPGNSSRQYQPEDHRQQDRQDKEQRQSSSWRRDNGPSSTSSLGHHQPRKSKSYPPATFATMGADSGRPWKQQHRRRLSSNDRLQIRMNPRPGDLLNDMPDLFPSRSMSGLVRPEFHSSVTGSSFSGAEDSFSTAQSYAMSTEDEDLRYGGAMGGRQSRLQRRRKVPSMEEEDVDEEVERVDQQRRRRGGSQDRRKESRRRRRKSKDGGRGYGHEQGPGKRQPGVHAQHFNFKAQCQLMLTPEVMAACMLENISVEVWKLNPKRQTMIELGSAKLPLHKVLSRILQKTAATSASGAEPYGSSRGKMWGGPEGPQDSYYGSGSAERVREWHQQQHQQHQRGRGGGAAQAAGAFKEGWRLEPSLYDIRSRQGTVIGQLDADVWILPRSRSDSMVSAAA